jgi:hypothetical protein
MDLELSGRRVAATSLRSRTREVIRSRVVAETARLFDLSVAHDEQDVHPVVVVAPILRRATDL